MESTAQGPQSWFLELGFEIATGQRVKERFPLRGLKIYIYIYTCSPRLRDEFSGFRLFPFGPCLRPEP